MLRQRLDSLSEGLMAFWREHGPDTEFGGFHGTLDRRGVPKEPTDKGLIQQSRHLWTFSMWYERREPSLAIKAVADDVYRFLIDHFKDPKGDEFVFKVSRDGQRVVEPKKQLYAESFAIYALSEYGRVFGVEDAKMQALACFRSIDARSHDAEHLGYDQSTDPGWLTPGAQKETNTHIHLLEAFTALFRATGDPTVKKRLAELVTVTSSKLLQKSGYVHQEFLKDWTPHREPVCSYGHDLETVWLLLDAAGTLGQPSAQVVESALLMGEHAAQFGYDEQLGGYFEEGPPHGGAAKLNKIWWVQVEALAGLWRLYQLTNDERHLQRLERTLDFIEKYQLDVEFGELYWEVNPDGSVGPHGTDKGEEWKTAYHAVRAAVFTSDWISGKP